MAESKDIGTDAATIDQYTILSGDRSKLKDLLSNRLSECGWREEVRGLCRNSLENRDMQSSVDDLLAEVTPKARALVPDAVKNELLLKIRNILSPQPETKACDS